MKLHVLGAGGHAKVVLDSIKINKYSGIYFYDDKFPKSKKFYNFNIIGKFNDLPKNKKDLYFVAIGDNSFSFAMAQPLFIMYV